jgi:hypothetical protein
MDGSSNPSASPEASGEPAAKTAEPARALDFVSEEDVRKAVQEGRKLPIGPKTIVTPSARDLGNEASVFIRV